MITCTKVNSVGGGMKKVNTHNHNHSEMQQITEKAQMVEFGYYNLIIIKIKMGPFNYYNCTNAFKV